MKAFNCLFIIIVPLFILCEGAEKMNYNKLTPEEENVIIHKGTERPFSGEFFNKFEKGIYVCKRCNAPLYNSDSKFESSCGWPSFDEEIPGAVKRIADTDGMRTEIVCAKCNAHLGHVFSGEGFTQKNARHCVNSISLKFIPESRIEKAIFAGGCFWGVEYYLQKEKGVIATAVGYIGGNCDNPDYEKVCSHTTGHAEAVEVTYNSSVTSFETLARLFFEIHDPTEVNRQGPDIGDQYRSEIFYTDDTQKTTAEKLIKLLSDKGYTVATKVSKAGKFWKAEEYHQDYYDKKNGSPYCHMRVKRF